MIRKEIQQQRREEVWKAQCTSETIFRNTKQGSQPLFHIFRKPLAEKCSGVMPGCSCRKSTSQGG